MSVPISAVLVFRRPEVMRRVLGLQAGTLGGRLRSISVSSWCGACGWTCRMFGPPLRSTPRFSSWGPEMVLQRRREHPLDPLRGWCCAV